MTIHDVVTDKSSEINDFAERVRMMMKYARCTTRMEPEVGRMLNVLRATADRQDDGAVKDLINDTATVLEWEWKS